MSRALIASLAAALALVAAGCGGSGSAGTAVAAEVADLVPASVPVVLALETDPESEQWRQASALLDLFPGKAKLLEELRSELESDGMSLEGDLLPALGDETYVVVTGLDDDADAVVITQPRDPAKLAQLLGDADEPSATRELNGWTLIAEDDEALAPFGEGGERLTDADWFDDAQERVEGGALVTFLGNGAAIQEEAFAATAGPCPPPERKAELDYVVGTLTAEDDGVRLLFAASGDGAEDLVGDETLLDHVPAGTLAYFGAPSFDVAALGLTDQLRCQLDGAGAPDAEGLLGVSYDDVLDLFAGGFALSARPSALIPEVTLLLAPEDEERALELLDSLAERAGSFLGAEARTRRVGDVDARELRLGPVTILYGSGDGRVAITTAPTGFDGLTGEGDSLEDDEAFRRARDAAGIGDEEAVFAYVDLDRVLELVGTVAAFSDEEIPAEVQANLEPLESLLAWGDVSDPNEPELGLFLALR